LIPQSCTQKIVQLKETLCIALRDDAWIYVAPVPEHLTVLCKDQKCIDIEIKGNGVLTFLTACTSYGSRVMIKSLNVHSVNNTEKIINQPLNLTHDCCDMTADALPLGEIQLEIPIKSNPTHDGDLHLASPKIEKVPKIVDEQEWKVTHAEGKNM
jgi:hypothetical protein